MSAIDELVRNAQSYAEHFDKGELPLPPAKRVAIVACMDARLNPYGLLGLEEGDAHVIRNAGGVITDDEIRSLAISQRLLGTEEIILIHHTDCGMLTFHDDEFKAQIQQETGIKPRRAVSSSACSLMWSRRLQNGRALALERLGRARAPALGEGLGHRVGEDVL